MRFNKFKNIEDIAKKIGAQLLDDSDGKVWGINEIHKVENGDITFVDYEKYYNKSLNSAATYIIIDKVVDVPKGKALLVVDNPFEAYNNLCLEYLPGNSKLENNASINTIHETAIVEMGAVIGTNVSIGAGSVICSNVVIHDNTIIGKNVIVQSGSQIGNDAFYFKKIDGSYKKWHSVGRVILEDNVDIGTLCSVNKGVSGDTIVGEGTKLDGQVHLGHGVVIGKNCIIAAQVGIAGKVTVGDNCTIYGQVGVAQGVTIGDNTVVYAKSGVSKDIKGGKTYYGVPAEDVRIKFKEHAMIKRLREGKLGK